MEKYIKKVMPKDLMKSSLEYIKKVDLINSIKINFKENEDQYFINCLVVGDTDLIRNELSEIELKLLNELQKLNIVLIQKGTDNEKRKMILRQHANNFKLINF